MLFKKECDESEIWVKRCERDGGKCGSRLKARVVETRENERRDAGFLVVVAVCQRRPKIEFSVETSESRVPG